MAISRPAFIILLLSVTGLGCDDSATPKASVCGTGPAVLQIGIEDPLEPVPEVGFSIDEGLQGGYHIDVSVRLTGVFDPDKVDISMTLTVDDTLVARHRTDDWLLKIYKGGPHCEYPRARLVLSQRDGSLFELERVMALVGRTGMLEMTLKSPLGQAEGQYEIVFSHINRR